MATRDTDSPPSRDRDWPRLEALLDRLLELPEEGIAAALDRLDAADVPLRPRLEAALAAARGSAGPLGQGSAGERFAPLLASVAAPDPGAETAGTVAPGTLVGRWRVTGELGRGGMGTVYAAERADGEYRQQAALKLVRLGVDDAPARARFLRERQILADLEHPGIARLLDGGVTSEGRPYLVLERVDGEPITTWCNRECASVDRRIELFLAVLGAVEYAHRNLVVHRDLKPSNILVSRAGEPKLLDFGIAKMLDPDAAEDLTHTLAGVPLTPQYAAPEQVTGKRITTATDVYALGLVLYELLTGEKPYRLTSSSALELERQIVAGDTTPPSRAARRADERGRRTSHYAREARATPGRGSRRHRPARSRQGAGTPLRRGGRPAPRPRESPVRPAGSRPSRLGRLPAAQVHAPAPHRRGGGGGGRARSRRGPRRARLRAGGIPRPIGRRPARTGDPDLSRRAVRGSRTEPRPRARGHRATASRPRFRAHRPRPRQPAPGPGRPVHDARLPVQDARCLRPRRRRDRPRPGAPPPAGGDLRSRLRDERPDRRRAVLGRGPLPRCLAAARERARQVPRPRRRARPRALAGSLRTRRHALRPR